MSATAFDRCRECETRRWSRRGTAPPPRRRSPPALRRWPRHDAAEQARQPRVAEELVTCRDGAGPLHWGAPPSSAMNGERARDRRARGSRRRADHCSARSRGRRRASVAAVASTGSAFAGRWSKQASRTRSATSSRSWRTWARNCGSCSDGRASASSLEGGRPGRDTRRGCRGASPRRRCRSARRGAHRPPRWRGPRAQSDSARCWANMVASYSNPSSSNWVLVDDLEERQCVFMATLLAGDVGLEHLDEDHLVAGAPADPRAPPAPRRSGPKRRPERRRSYGRPGGA